MNCANKVHDCQREPPVPLLVCLMPQILIDFYSTLHPQLAMDNAAVCWCCCASAHPIQPIPAHLACGWSTSWRHSPFFSASAKSSETDPGTDPPPLALPCCSLARCCCGDCAFALLAAAVPVPDRGVPAVAASEPVVEAAPVSEGEGEGAAAEAAAWWLAVEVLRAEGMSMQPDSASSALKARSTWMDQQQEAVVMSNRKPTHKQQHTQVYGGGVRWIKDEPYSANPQAAFESSNLAATTEAITEKH